MTAFMVAYMWKCLMMALYFIVAFVEMPLEGVELGVALGAHPSSARGGPPFHTPGRSGCQSGPPPVEVDALPRFNLPRTVHTVGRREEGSAWHLCAS